MLVFSVTTLGTNTSVPFTCPAEGSDGVISSMRRRPLLLCLAAGLAKHTATNAVQTNQVDMRTEEMRTLYICFAFALYICGHDMRRGGAFRAPDISVRLQDSTNGSGPFPLRASSGPPPIPDRRVGSRTNLGNKTQNTQGKPSSFPLS